MIFSVNDAETETETKNHRYCMIWLLIHGSHTRYCLLFGLCKIDHGLTSEEDTTTYHNWAGRNLIAVGSYYLDCVKLIMVSQDT